MSNLLEFKKENCALIFIEFQQEWFNPQGHLQQKLIEDKEQFRIAVENATSIITSARAGGWRVVHAGLNLRGDPKYLVYGGGKTAVGIRKAIPEAGIWTKEGPEFVPPFNPRENEFVVTGRSGASTLKNSTLDPYLRSFNIDTVILMGFAIHVCVESTMREAHDIGYRPLVVTDASCGFTADQPEYFRKHIAHHFGEAIETKVLLDRLKKG